jgi:ACT domain-containing protein
MSNISAKLGGQNAPYYPYQDTTKLVNSLAESKPINAEMRVTELLGILENEMNFLAEKLEHLCDKLGPALTIPSPPDSIPLTPEPIGCNISIKLFNVYKSIKSIDCKLKEITQRISL